MSNQAATSKAAKRQAIRERMAKHGNPFKSKMLLIALTVMMLGGVVWAYSAATRPEQTTQAAGGAAPGVNGLTASSDGQTVKIESDPRLIDQSGPAAFRLGLSFAIGYFLAWGARVFLKVTLLFFGALGVVLILLTHYHVFGLDWSLLQDKLESSMAFLQGEAEKFKDFVMGYLPSTASGVAGLVFGWRKRA